MLVQNPDLGTRLIVIYKLVRGALALTLALVLAGVLITGGGMKVHSLAEMGKDHVSGAWSMKVADLLVKASTQRHLQLGACAFACDGIFTLFEGWSLRQRFWWAPWLVVVATASFLPLEILVLIRGVRAGRLALFL